MSNPWPDCPRLPKGAAAVLATLHLREPDCGLLRSLTEREWHEALDFSDSAQLTLTWREAAGEAWREAAPVWVARRLERNASDNLERLLQFEELYGILAARFRAAGIEFLALKGLTQCQLFGSRPEHRQQSDIDIFTPRASVEAARDALLALGFEPLQSLDRLPTDHLPMLIRKTGWEWRGNFFDPKMPIAVEPHFQFWNPSVERLPAPSVEQFWDRRVRRMIAGTDLPVLHAADALGYAALHLLRHVLRGTASPFHAYEVACFLELHADDGAFWEEWRGLHAPELRRLEAVCFRLAAEWFGCRLHALAQEEADRLPASTQAWFDDFALQPATAPFHASKSELWLHISLLDSWRDALSVARRRLLPGKLPGPVDAVHFRKGELSWHRRLLRAARYAAYAARRLRYHAAAVLPTAASGVQWWWRVHHLGRHHLGRHGLGTQFWTFLAVAVVFNLGLYIFVLLYNLFLVDLGYREDFLGVVNGAARVGSLAGTIPAAFLAHHYGLRNCLVATIAVTAAIETARAFIGAQAPVAALSLLSGFIFALWAVIMTPIIAGTVETRNRPTAFSLFFACMFAIGIVGGWLGGQLTVWMHGKRPVLLLSAAMAGLAVIPALRLRAGAAVSDGTRVYPRNRFFLRFLGPFAVWHMATGSFNPFNNVYFSRLGFPVQQIGNIFSGSQLVQVGAVLLAPLVIRRAGLTGGIVLMMAATAAALGGLAAPALISQAVATPASSTPALATPPVTQASGVLAILAYFFYMAFQWMSEPGLSTLLMNQVAERERSGASALAFLVAFGAQALAAFAAGELLARFGYGAVLAGAAGLAALAAGLFRRFVRA